MLSPPSAAIVAPVMNDDSSLARNSTALAISSGPRVPVQRDHPVEDRVASSSLAPVAPTSIVCWKRLSTGPGWMLFTRMPFGAPSCAAVRMRPTSACLAVA